jgi:hypothetical protein
MAMPQLSRIVGHLVSSKSPLHVVATDWFLDIRPHDHRAWFGLGQAYALLTMYRYSLHYYHRALTLKYAHCLCIENIVDIL